MTTLLLIVIFIGFISLGIPDSLLGAAWPAVSADLGLPSADVSFISFLITGGTVLSSFLSGRIIRKLGEPRVTVLSTALTALSLTLFSVSHNMAALCLLAVPLGLGAGAIDTALNNFVALHCSPACMSFLHCFYGIGVSISPYCVSLALSGQGSWRAGYRTMSCVQWGIVAVMILSLPLWKRAGNRNAEEEPTENRLISLPQALKLPLARTCFLVFLASNALESVCTVWAATFLVQMRSLSAEQAAGCVTFYFAGLACGRFLSGVLSKNWHCMKIIWVSQIFSFAAAVLLLLPLPTFAVTLGLFLIGLGNGPLHPNMLQLTPEHFGADISQSMMGYEIGFAYSAILVTPLIFGFFATKVGYGLFAWSVAALFALLVYALVLLRRAKNKQK